MNSVLIISVIALASIGVIAAILLYIAAKKFHVNEDKRIGVVEELLPGANCGGCGFPGCHGLAEAIVKDPDNKKLKCPVGGSETMTKIAEYLGTTAVDVVPQVSVVRCFGSSDVAVSKYKYDGASSCANANLLSTGESGCKYGCLKLGDCTRACPWEVITLSKETGLPRVDESRCVACGACVAACPRGILQLRNKGPKGRRVYVGCVNQDKGAQAIKNCKVACIGCGKCFKECPFGAITIENNKAYIDYEKCKLCRKCVDVCPTKAIHAVGFPEKLTPNATTSTEIKSEVEETSKDR
ncbi:MAG: RnfABCDGE type electron transport complex subunit B [Bacteroidales bacterium]|jgi:electron transport complex protein RnfB